MYSIYLYMGLYISLSNFSTSDFTKVVAIKRCPVAYKKKLIINCKLIIIIIRFLEIVVNKRKLLLSGLPISGFDYTSISHVYYTTDTNMVRNNINE